MEFRFGDTPKCKKWEQIHAPNIDVAKKMFMASVLYPEHYVAYDQMEGYEKPEDEDLPDDPELDDECSEPEDEEEEDEEREEPDAPPVPRADAYIQIYDEEWNEIGKLPYKECVEFEYGDIQSTSQRLIGSPAGDAEFDQKSLPVIGKPALLPLTPKSELRRKHELIEAKLGELEQAKRELELAARALKRELSSKKRVIAMIETFLGVSEEVVLLKDGEPAPEEEPLHVFQQLLFMDEEIGIWSEGGLGYEDIDKFDEWVVQNAETFLYKPKSVCAFRVRREEKKYTDDPLVNFWMNQENFNTYWFVRNGSRYYRIWSGIHINEKVFPTNDEMAEVMEEASRWGGEYGKDKVESWQNRYIFGMLALQGMIERTDMFGTSLRGHVNFAKPHGIPEDRVILVRDAETNHWIGDGRPSWYEYRKANGNSIKVGSRIVISRDRWRMSNENNWRTYPFKASHPSHEEVYTVDEVFGKENRWSTEGDFVIRYREKGENWYRQSDGWRGTKWVLRERKNRVPFKLYRDEALNLDEITLEDIEYYMHCRLYRKDYLDMLPALHLVLRIKREERALEAEFVRLLASKLGWEEGRHGEIFEAIDWWKLKNKWKRAVTADEPKAMRMILKRLQEEER